MKVRYTGVFTREDRIAIGWAVGRDDGKPADHLQVRLFMGDALAEELQRLKEDPTVDELLWKTRRQPR